MPRESSVGLETDSRVAMIEAVGYHDIITDGSVDAMISHITAVSGPKVVIIESVLKSDGMAELAKAIEVHEVIHVFLVGQEAGRIEAALRSVGFEHLTRREGDYDRIVRDCYAVAEPSDVVLRLGLGVVPGDRSKSFRAAVINLEVLVGAQ